MIRIISDGTPSGTIVTADGEELTGVVEAHWALNASDGLARVTLVMDACEVDVLGETP